MHPGKLKKHPRGLEVVVCGYLVTILELSWPLLELSSAAPGCSCVALGRSWDPLLQALGSEPLVLQWRWGLEAAKLAVLRWFGGWGAAKPLVLHWFETPRTGGNVGGRGLL